MQKNSLLALGTVSLLAASYFGFFAPDRFGTYDEGEGHRASCEAPTAAVKELTEWSLTLIAHIALTEAEPPRGEFNPGTCPYQEHRARTYALELWALGILGVIGAAKRNYKESRGE